jgi:hypothetical protein
VAAFLSDAWLLELDAAAQAGALAVPHDLVVQQIVVDDQGGEVAYAIRVRGGQVRVVPGRADDADVTFTQDRATAESIARGAVSAQVAFLAGRLRVGGDLRAVLDRAGALADIGDLFAAARDTTSW